MKIKLGLLLTTLFWNGISNASGNDDVPVAYQWILTAESDQVSFFLNVETIKDLGSNRKQVWVMMDYNNQQKMDSLTYQSRKTESIYDCRHETRTLISWVIYEKAFGGGSVVDSHEYKSEDQELENVAPESTGEAIFKAVCE